MKTTNQITPAVQVEKVLDIIKSGLPDAKVFCEVADHTDGIWEKPEQTWTEIEKTCMEEWDALTDELLDTYNLAGAIKFMMGVEKFTPDFTVEQRRKLAFRIFTARKSLDCDYSTEEFFNCLSKVREGQCSLADAVCAVGNHCLDDVIEVFESHTPEEVKTAIEFDTDFMSGVETLNDYFTGHWYAVSECGTLDNAAVLEEFKND